MGKVGRSLTVSSYSCFNDEIFYLKSRLLADLMKF